ncbi:MAG: virulence protein RhuM/Fic/DOC family protein [Candidatus Peregrinibacteria bacterium]|nr:virulence protein RhuM/Fic/DOC family protein [Candidatus Peregrinibacteria bacterium]
MKKENGIIIYQAKTGAIELKEDVSAETIWATQAEIADLFEVERSVATKHINNILKDKELSEDSVCANIAHTAKDGKTYKVQYYNLDIILAVGYRTNSARAIQFRKWATKILHQHIVDGYTINKKRLARNYDLFLKAVEQVRTLLPSGGTVGATDALELIKMFANTWFSLDAYDKENFPKTGVTKKEFKLTAKELTDAISDLKIGLTKSGQAGEFFGISRKEQSIEGILGNVLQSFGGKDLYSTIEEKAAHLLYFTVKNHPFIDGNKRSGAFTFVWFLKRTGLLNPIRMTPEALTALTLLIAESNPKDKGRMIGLILLILN